MRWRSRATTLTSSEHTSRFCRRQGFVPEDFRRREGLSPRGWPAASPGVVEIVVRPASSCQSSSHGSKPRGDVGSMSSSVEHATPRNTTVIDDEHAAGRGGERAASRPYDAPPCVLTKRATAACRRSHSHPNRPDMRCCPLLRDRRRTRHRWQRCSHLGRLAR